MSNKRTVKANLDIRKAPALQVLVLDHKHQTQGEVD